MSAQHPPGAAALTDDGDLAPGAEEMTAHGIPAFMASDKHTRAWLLVFDHGSLFRGWHPTDVEWALGEAHRLLRRLGGRVGPKGASGYWPAMVEEEGIQAARPARRRIAPSEVTAMEAATAWAWTYLGPIGARDPHEKERRAVQRWCWCTETNTNHTRFLREAGIPRASETRHWRRGFTIIATGLCTAGVRIPREVLLARLEQARSEVRNDAPDALAAAALAGELPEQPTRAIAHLPVIDGMWRDAELCRLLAPEAQAYSVLAILQERARLEAACGVIAETGPALSARVAQLRAEAVVRGLIATDARQGGALSREDLTARIERNKEHGQ